MEKTKCDDTFPGILSKATTKNPKDLTGRVKVSVSKLPSVGILQGAMAMMDGATKYGPYNWRDRKVIASIYVDSMYRHIMQFFEGQEQAEDSNVHHLGHVIACASLLLDAQVTGNLIDDRPKSMDEYGNGHWLSDFMDMLSEDIKARKEKEEESKASKERMETEKCLPEFLPGHKIKGFAPKAKKTVKKR